MAAFLTYDLMAPLMFAGLIVFLIIGFPVAFSLIACGLSFALLGIELGFFQPAFLQGLPPRVFGILSNELLLAIPFFTLMGAVLERSGLAEDLLEGMGQLFGGLPGGLGYAVILVGAVLGAITGTVAASVIAMGMIAMPAMLRTGYDPRYATGVVAASGTITQVIPPSLVLIVLAEVLGKPVGDMYLGAIGPSIMQTGLFLLYTAAVALISPKKVPPLPESARTLRGAALAWTILKAIIPSLGLIFLVLGTIFLGLATPTEAGAMGTVGAIVLATANGRFSLSLLWQGMATTMRITAMVVFILIGATVFSLVFAGVEGGHWLEDLLRDLPGGQTGFLIFVNVFIFLLSFFLDFFEIAFIILPLLLPTAKALDIDLVWFGVMLCVNMQTSFMHPPFGFALFYVRSVTPASVKTRDIYLGAIPFLVLQLVLVAIVVAWPETVTAFIGGGPVVDPGTVTIDIAPPPDIGDVPLKFD
ncbi:TRAP transporter large permease subunit [Elioraea sp.]|uniref:TRAP transporter large permease n=1 Tax=Elioraea sp. TaxID=2185103 RepID=UPI0025BBA387|nr:TRAP transporter large permease subunit [Elioraea sp.]